VVLGLILGPDLDHRLGRSVSSRIRGLRVGVVVAHLLAVPAGSDTVDHPPVGESTSTVATSFAVRMGSCCGTRHTPVAHFRVVVAPRRSSPRTVRMSSHTGSPPSWGPIHPDRQMRVLGEPQALQATVLDHPTESTWCRGVDGGEHRDTDLHAVINFNSYLAASNRAWLSSVRREAAVHWEGHAEHEAGGQAQQPQCCCGDLLGPARPADRLVAHDFLHRVGLVLDHVR
jgi:hypothetical protein